MNLWSKVGVSALSLVLVALPVAACVLPGAAMTSAERDCCKKMAEQCGHAGMAKLHSCCKISPASSEQQALKATSSHINDLSPLVSHALQVSTQVIPSLSGTLTAFQFSDTHSPPGLESLATTVLRI